VTPTIDTAVVASVEVNVPAARAFSVFTDEIASWWPPEHHIGGQEVAGMAIEPRYGGRAFDRFADGSESQWGRVLGYEPPNKLVLSWDISPEWQLQTDPVKTSEVVVRFIAEGPDRTQVVLEHRNLDRHGPGWEQLRDMVAGTDGWPLSLRRFAERASA
jgi:uncharacterized protein YndB with AHSA1/START domain